MACKTQSIKAIQGDEKPGVSDALYRECPVRETLSQAPSVIADVRTAAFWFVVCGFGMLRIWSVVAGSPTVYLPLNSTAFAVGTRVGVAEDICYAALLLAAGLVTLRIPRTSRSWMMIGSSVALCVATACFGIASFSDALPVSGVIVARIAFALAALTVVVWAEQLCRFSVGGIVACVAVAYAVAYASAVFLSGWPPVVCSTVQAVLPLAWTGVWLRLRRTCPPPQASGLSVDCGRPKGRTVAYVLVGAGCYGAILLLANGFSEGKTSLPNEYLSLYAGLLTSIVVAVCVVAIPRSVSLALVFRLMLPALVLCVSVVFAIEAGQQPYEVVIIGCTWTFYIICTWGLWGAMAFRVSMPPLCLFAFGSAALSLCTLGGDALYKACAPMLTGNFAMSATACVAAVLVSTFLLNERKVFVVTQGIPSESPVSSHANDPHALVELAARRARLTQREREIVLCVLQGQDNPSIVEELSISSATLYTHLRNIYKKTGTHARQELVDWVREVGV